MKLTEKILIEDLKRVGDLLGKVPTGTEYEKYGKYSLFPYKSKKRWLEWCNICFKDDKTVFKQTLVNTNVEELKQDLLRIYKHVNSIPSKRDYVKHGEYSIQSYLRIKPWSEWCKEIFPDFKKSNSLKIPEEELIKDLMAVRNICNHPPSINEYKKYGKYGLSVYRKVKNWNLWMKDIFKSNCGAAPNKISDDELIKNLLELHIKLDRVPQKSDLSINNGSKYSINAYKRAFGSLEKALISVDLRPNQVRNKPKQEIIDDLKDIYDKLKRTPSMKEYRELSNIGYSCPTIKKIFGSWTKALIASEIPVVKARNVSKQDVIDALNIWYRQNNNNPRCLEYWKIRKAKRSFPYSCVTISNKFDNISWEEIMRQIDPEYKTIDQFVKRGSFVGVDGNTYLSSIEKTTGDILYNFKLSGEIDSYEYEHVVCPERSWTCDFLVNGDIWLEIDGMRENRKDPYKSGFNEKIEYYKENNINYRILSYNNVDVKSSILSIIRDNSVGRKLKR